MTRISNYESRIDQFTANQAELEAESYKLSNYRLAIFVLGGIFGAIASVGVRSTPPMVILFLFLLSVLCFAGFVILVVKHRRVAKEENRNRVLKELNEHAIHRLNREWDEFPVPKSPEKYSNLPEALDLDIFGKASLFQLLSVQRTPQGRAKLAEWLIEPAVPAEIPDRQKAAEALSEHLNWRQDLAEIGGNLAVDEAVIIPEWLDKPEWLNQQDSLTKYLTYAPWVSLLSLIPTLLFPTVPAILIVAGFHFYLIRKNRNRVYASLHSIAEEDRKIRSYGEVFRYVKGCPVKNGRLSELLPKFDQACDAMGRFNSIATGAAAQGSMIHPILNALVVFDLQLVKKLEAWQGEYLDRFSDWFESLGEIEALACLASLHFDEADWSWATFKDSGALDAEKIGHPLIQAKNRVANDVSVGPEGHFLLVTGSNMAGKSTLLRSIGLNITLAQAGAPVCADLLAAPPLTIATSMGVQDSLADGISFFMAELQRIKEIVNLAMEERKQGRTVVFLFDEILQGTNTVERREIVQRVLANLVENQAMGAVTTHDLALAESEEIIRNADLIHFREHFERDADGTPKMTFDYKIHPGVATTTNALKILEVIEMPL